MPTRFERTILASLVPARFVTDVALNPEPFGAPPTVTVKIAAALGMDGVGLFKYCSAERPEKRIKELDRFKTDGTHRIGYAIAVAWQTPLLIQVASYNGTFFFSTERNRLAFFSVDPSAYYTVGIDIRGGVHVQADGECGITVLEI